MSRLLITSDLHLGHRNIHKYRTQFSTAEEHHEFTYEQLCTNVKKADTVYFLGDVAFDAYWLGKVGELRCKHKKLIVGNHDTEHHKMVDLCKVFDSVEGLMSKRNIWFTHCPIHPQEIRGKVGIIHGHLHQKVVDDSRYFNACVEHTEYKPITFADIIKRTGWEV